MEAVPVDYFYTKRGEHDDDWGSKPMEVTDIHGLSYLAPN